jgi:hypothetical protein
VCVCVCQEGWCAANNDDDDDDDDDVMNELMSTKCDNVDGKKLSAS